MDAFERFLEFIDRDGVVQAEIARAADVSEAYISRLKRRIHRPSPAVVSAVAEAMSAAGCFEADLDRARFELAFRNMPPAIQGAESRSALSPTG